MTTANVTSFTIGRVALAAALTGAVAIIFLALMFSMGSSRLRPFFGTINDVANAVLAIAGVAVVWTLFRQFRPTLGAWHQILLALAVVGAIVAVVGSVLVISGRTGFVLAGLYSATGFALIGLCIAALGLALRGNGLPTGVAIFGIVTGLIMVLGLGGLPGILRGADSLAAMSPLVSAPWMIGSIGWLFLQPIWYYVLSRALLTQS